MKRNAAFNINNEDWNQTSAEIFWGKITSNEHIVQVYDNDEVLIDTLSGFMYAGINAGDACIVIATETHLSELESRIKNHQQLIEENRYIPLNAEQVLRQFMINDWPDEDKFMRVISGIMQRAKQADRKVRAYGEMVAILWSRGLYAATIELENLWNRYCQIETFCLFCAYPKSAFKEDINTSLMHVCQTHCRIINGSEKQSAEVYHKEMI